MVQSLISRARARCRRACPCRAELELGERRREFDELIGGGIHRRRSARLCGAADRGCSVRTRGPRWRRTSAGSVTPPKTRRRATPGWPRTRSPSGTQVLAHWRLDWRCRRAASSSANAPTVDCAELTMPFAEYEWLRQNPWRFVAPPWTRRAGHRARRRAALRVRDRREARREPVAGSSRRNPAAISIRSVS